MPIKKHPRPVPMHDWQQLSLLEERTREQVRVRMHTWRARCSS
jgi:hypothetical protein